MEKNTYNFEYYPSDSKEKEVRLSFDCGDNIDMNEVISMFKTFAYALGYNEIAINSHFNTTTYYKNNE